MFYFLPFQKKLESVTKLVINGRVSGKGVYSAWEPMIGTFSPALALCTYATFKLLQ